MNSLIKRQFVTYLLLMALLAITGCAELQTRPVDSIHITKPLKETLPTPADLRETGSEDVQNLLKTTQIAVSDQSSNVVDVSGASRFIKIGNKSTTALKEIISTLLITLRSKYEYELAGQTLGNTLATPPKQSIYKQTLARSTPDGLHILQLAAVPYHSQQSRLWLYGVVEKNGERTSSADLDEIESMLSEVMDAPNAEAEKFTLADLEARVVRLSYSDPVQTLSSLARLGVTILTDGTESDNIDNSQLPMVMALASPTAEQMGLVGGGGDVVDSGNGRTMMPQAASKLETSTIGTPINQLLVLFNPAHPEQFNRVEKLLNNILDLPARQVYVEGMVLEISQNDLQELGVDWSDTNGTNIFTAGGMQAGGATETLKFAYDSTAAYASEILVNLRALVRDGKAEVLSRPSILTLDGRQATIRVGEDIPISKGRTTGISTTDSGFSFDFEYFPTGILLNIRPRVSADGKEVSMLIDTTVSAQVPGKELIVSDSAGTILAQAPTISNRRVQTYARIPDSTPLIIGGLVSKDESETNDKVPFLGDIPLLGWLFGSSTKSERKREVIIVLTPYVLNDKNDLLRSMPKDDDLFDSSGHVLFRDAYRIRSGDVFDLTFLTENKRLKNYTNLAQRAIESNFRLAETKPFSSFVGGRIPGEQILTERMIYDVIKRLGTAKKVNDERIIFFDSKNRQKYDVQYLSRVLKHLRNSEGGADILDSKNGKALALTFYYDRDQLQPGYLVSEPRAEATLVDCPDRKYWNKLLWEMNQPDKDGRRRYTILLNTPYDLKRLRRAIVIKRIIDLNGGKKNSTLDRFSAGRILPIPEISKESYSIIDADVARYFFHSELYYRASVDEMENTLALLDDVLGTGSSKEQGAVGE